MVGVVERASSSFIVGVAELTAESVEREPLGLSTIERAKGETKELAYVQQLAFMTLVDVG